MMAPISSADTSEAESISITARVCCSQVHAIRASWGFATVADAPRGALSSSKAAAAQSMSGVTPQAAAIALTVLIVPAAIMSAASPIRALLCETAAAALPYPCSRSSAAMPARSLPTPASLKMAARA